MERWKENYEELLSVEFERQTEYEEEENIQEQKEEMRDEAIIIEEVIEAVQMLKIGKVAEQDLITVEMLQNMGENRFEMLTELYNKIGRGREVRKRLGCWKVIPLFQKGDDSNCSNYKGFALFSVVLNWY